MGVRMKKLPVFQSFKEVFAGVTRHYFELIRVAPFAVTIILLAYLGLFISSSAETAGQPAGESIRHVPWPVIAVAIVALVVAFPSAAVRWHRFVLFGERPTGALASFWGRNQTLYFLNTFKFILLMGGLAAATVVAVFGIGAGIAAALRGAGGLFEDGTVGFGALTAAAVVVFYPACIYLAARLTVAFPAVALGQDASFRKAMEETRGNGWRLLGYTLLVQIAVALAVMIFGAVVGAVAGLILALLLPPDAVRHLIGYINILTLPAVLYQLMVGVTMMSVAYREIVGLPPEPETIGEGTRQPA